MAATSASINAVPYQVPILNISSQDLDMFEMAFERGIESMKNDPSPYYRTSALIMQNYLSQLKRRLQRGIG